MIYDYIFTLSIKEGIAFNKSLNLAPYPPQELVVFLRLQKTNPGTGIKNE